MYDVKTIILLLISRLWIKFLFINPVNVCLSVCHKIMFKQFDQTIKARELISSSLKKLYHEKSQTYRKALLKNSHDIFEHLFERV